MINKRFSTGLTFIRSNRLILAGVGIIVLISVNIAWFNPRPGYPVVKVPSVPLMWQYNLDSGTELRSAVQFPDVFRQDPVRCARPGFPLLINAVMRVLQVPLFFWKVVSPFEAGAIAYFLVKLAIYIVGGLLLAGTLAPYVGETAGKWASFFLITHNFSMTYLTTFHTTDMEYFSPVILVFLFSNYLKEPRRWKLICNSFLAGYLSLIKPNYAVYLAIVLFGLHNRRWRESAVSFICYLIPYWLWRFALHVMQIPYFSAEKTTYKMGLPYLSELLTQNLLKSIQEVLVSLSDFAVANILFYSVFLILFLLYAREYFKKEPQLKIFVFLCVSMTWVQHFAARKPAVAVMASDYAFLVFGLGSYGLVQLVERAFPAGSKWMLRFICVLWVASQAISLIGFPWISPENQPEAPLSRHFVSSPSEIP